MLLATYAAALSSYPHWFYAENINALLNALNAPEFIAAPWASRNALTLRLEKLFESRADSENLFQIFANFANSPLSKRVADSSAITPKRSVALLITSQL